MPHSIQYSLLIEGSVLCSYTPASPILLLCFHLGTKASGSCFNIFLEIGSSSHVSLFFFFFIISSKPQSCLQFHSQMKYTKFLVGKISEYLSVLSLLKWLIPHSWKLTPLWASVRPPPPLVSLLPLWAWLHVLFFVHKPLEYYFEQDTQCWPFPSIFSYFFLPSPIK